MKIPFNKPFLTGNENKYIKEAVESGHISGNGIFTKKCQLFFEERYGFKKTLLTTSCTDALEMCAILLDIKLGDEVIVPSYTFVSTALAFVRQGAKIKFADSSISHPNVDIDSIEKEITERTKAIVVVHYAGMAVDMDAIMKLSEKYNIKIVEDAAQAIDSYYKNKPLGGIGHLGTFSFHETKNIISGEGGLLIINDDEFINRSEIIWEKGTNRASFFRGEVNKYGWVDTGSSFLPSEIVAAFLYAQLEKIDKIQKRRKQIWEMYNSGLKNIVDTPIIPNEATINGHMFYIITQNIEERTSLINYLKKKGIMAVFHYLSLHKSSFILNKTTESNQELPLSDFYSDTLLRLPLYYKLDDNDVYYIIDSVRNFYKQKNNFK